MSSRLGVLVLFIFAFSISSSQVFAISDQAAEDQAYRLYSRLAGRSPSAEIWGTMKQNILDGNVPAAAFLAIDDAGLGFYKSTLVNMFSALSNTAENSDLLLSDFTATVVGLTYNNNEFNKILYDDIFYTAPDELQDYYYLRDIDEAFPTIPFDGTAININDDTITIPNHGLYPAHRVQLISLGGPLPFIGGQQVNPDTTRWVKVIDENTIALSDQNDPKDYVNPSFRQNFTATQNGDLAIELQEIDDSVTNGPFHISRDPNDPTLRLVRLSDNQDYRDVDGNLIMLASGTTEIFFDEFKVRPLFRAAGESNVYDDGLQFTDLERRYSSNWPQLLVAREQSEIYEVLSGDRNIPASDVMGAVTTRQYGEAVFTAGTNRRAFSHTMKTFFCKDMTQLHDPTAPDIRVRRDIDRAPGGSNENYQTQCRGCHAGMDGMAGAFAFFDYRDSQLRHDSNGLSGTPSQQDYETGSNQKKQWRQFNIFLPGHLIKNNTWYNFWTSGPNVTLGWRVPPSGQSLDSGTGAHALGEVLAHTEAFSDCMVERVFARVCLRNPTGVEAIQMKQIARQYEEGFASYDSNDADSPYNMRGLFARVSQMCFGNE